MKVTALINSNTFRFQRDANACNIQHNGVPARCQRLYFAAHEGASQEPVLVNYSTRMWHLGASAYKLRNAKQKQSPDMGDALLHETAVSWFRKGMKSEQPECVPWEETPAQWARRAQRVVRKVNRGYDVAGLCREFPSRLADLVDAGGDRLRK